MFSQNPRFDFFRIILPDTFFIRSITERYDALLKQKPYIFDTIENMLLESIQGFDTPEFGYTVSEQNRIDADNAGYGVSIIPKDSIQKLAEKTFSITFRHTDGFLTYFLLLEHFFKRYEMGHGSKEFRKPFGQIILETTIPAGQTICRIKYAGCKLVSVPSLSLSYTSPSRDLSSFNCTFSYESFSTTFDTGSLKLT